MKHFYCAYCNEEVPVAKEQQETTAGVCCRDCSIKMASMYDHIRENMNRIEWKQFKDVMPEDDTRLLICGYIDTDPLYQSNRIQFMEFIDYKDGLLVPDDDGIEWHAPDPEDYWMYQKDIKTPFKDK